MKSSTVCVTSAQPLWMVSECPQPDSSVNPLRPIVLTPLGLAQSRSGKDDADFP